MIDPIVTITDRHQSGATSYLEVLRQLGAGEPIPSLGTPCALSEAMELEWENDAHFVCYVAADASGDEAPLRVNKRKSTFVPELLADGGQLLVRVLAFDHDLHVEGHASAPGRAPAKRPWSGDDLEEFVRGLGEGVAPYTPTYWYTTKHGSRFVFVLSEAVGPEVAEALSAGVIRDFLEAGIELDPSCKDWTREFRLPKTVRDDGGAWYRESEHFMLVPFGELLDPHSVTPGELKKAGTYSNLSMEFGEKPDEAECHAILYEKSDKGNEVMTSWHKRAKRQLGGSDAFPVCFDDVKIDSTFIAKKGYGGRNEGLTKIAGSMCGLLIAFDDTTEEHIYALLRGALEQLSADCPENEDWTEIGWDIICRMWEGEMSQLAAQRAISREAEVRAEGEKADIVATMREAAKEPVPDDDVEAREWLEQRMLASDGERHRIMRPDGTYTVKGFPSSILVAAIRDLGVDHLIRTHDIVGNVLKVRSVNDILTDHAIPVSRTLATACETTSYIQGPPGDRELVMPIHQLDDTLEPRFDHEIDEWLQAFFGDRYADGIDWLTNCLKVQRPICAINLYGASGAGKGMFVQGVAECFRVKTANDGRVLGRFNIGLADTPLVNFDEGLPGTMPGCASVDQTFRVLTAGGTLPLEGKNKDIIHGTVYPRVIFTSNDLDIIQGIIGNRDLNDDDVAALESRLLTIRIPQAASNLLMSRGQYAYTRQWIGHNSEHRLARHILALNVAQEDVKGTGRFLVEGDRGSKLMEGMRLRTEASQLVIRLLVELIESNTTGQRSWCLKHEGRVWTTPSAMVEYAEKKALSGVRLSAKAAGRVLRQIGEQKGGWHSPFKGAPRSKWFEVDLSIVIREALAMGRPCEGAMQLYSQSHGHEALGQLLEACRG